MSKPVMPKNSFQWLIKMVVNNMKAATSLLSLVQQASKIDNLQQVYAIFWLCSPYIIGL